MDHQCVTDAAMDTDNIDGSEGYASLHWSMENIHKYYDVTGRLLAGFVDHNFSGNRNGSCESMEHLKAINNLCDNLVNSLNKCANECCGNVIHNRKKVIFNRSDDLKKLTQQCLFTCIIGGNFVVNLFMVLLIKSVYVLKVNIRCILRIIKDNMSTESNNG